MKAARTAKFPKVLVIDVGGTSVKMLATGQKKPRKYASGRLPWLTRTGQDVFAEEFIGSNQAFASKTVPSQ